MLLNIFKRKKIKEVFLLEKEFLIKIYIVENKHMIYIKKIKILKNNFKLKERLKEHFDVFFQNKKRNKIFPIIKLTEKNVKENELNYAIQIGETSNNIIYCVLEYNNATVANKDRKEEKGVVFYTNNRVIKKENIKFKLPIGKDFTYLELKGEKGLMVI